MSENGYISRSYIRPLDIYILYNAAFVHSLINEHVFLQDYIVKFRCLAFLEQQLEEYERVEQDRMEEQQIATRKILERMKQDETLR